MLCWVACQQGHFWLFILLIPTDVSCFVSSKSSTHFCLLAHVCQHTFFLTQSAVNYSTTHIPAKPPLSHSVSGTRMIYKGFWFCFLWHSFLIEPIPLFIHLSSVIIEFKHSSLNSSSLHSYGRYPSSGLSSTAASRCKHTHCYFLSRNASLCQIILLYSLNDFF